MNHAARAANRGANNNCCHQVATDITMWDLLGATEERLSISDSCLHGVCPDPADPHASKHSKDERNDRTALGSTDGPSKLRRAYSSLLKDHRMENEIQSMLRSVEDSSSLPKKPQGAETSADGDQHEASSKKEYSVRQFPNGDLFSGNIDPATGELLYGRMTCSLDMEVYEGPFLNGERHGDGAVCTSMDGTGKFLGRYHHGKMCSGTLIVNRGTPGDFTYTGSFKDNAFHGEGSLATFEGTIYQGQFSLGKFHGIGTLHDSKRDFVYTGDFVDGLFNGSGTVVYADGSSFAGTWSQGQRVEGTETMSNGEIYEGKFRSDTRDGLGIIKTANKITRMGIWSNDNVVDGVSISMTFANGHTYHGEHMHSRPHGHGRMKYADVGLGEVTYTGQFFHGLRHGLGKCLFHKTGELYNGQWVCDEPADLFLFQHNGPLLDQNSNGLPSCEQTPVRNNTSSCKSVPKHIRYSIPQKNGKCPSAVSVSSTGTGETDDTTETSDDLCILSGPLFQSRPQHWDHGDSLISSLGLSLETLSVLEGPQASPKLHQYSNGDTFKGCLDEAQHRQGSGVYVEHRSGCAYKGDWKDSKRHGVGNLTLSSGVEYSGEFCHDAITGEGVMTLIDSSVYTGSFLNGLFHGRGTFEDALNSRTYIGGFDHGIRHGEGIESYADGSRFQGTFRYGKRHGKGVLYDQNDEIMYCGGWKDDLMHGKGVRRNPFEQNLRWEGVYEGDYVQGKRSGHGSFTYSDGMNIQGQWLNNVPQDGDWVIKYPDRSVFYGFATFRCAEKSSLLGGPTIHTNIRFPVPVPHGFGSITYPDGKRFTGSFVYGERSSPGMNGPKQ